MPSIPTLITDLSTTAASNAPAGTDSPSSLDDIQRAHGAFIAQLATGVASQTAKITGGTINSTPIGSTAPSTGAFTTLSATDPGPAITLSGATTATRRIDISNTGGGVNIGVENSGGGGIIAGATPYAAVINTTSAKPIQFGINSVLAATLDTFGNLGLGVTPQTGAVSSWKTLQIGAQSVFSGSGTTTVIGNNWYLNTGGTDTYLTTAAASLYRQTLGQHNWYNAPSGTAGNPITLTQAMTLTAGGSLLLGTSTETMGGISGSRINSASAIASVGIVIARQDTNKGYCYFDHSTSAMHLDSAAGTTIQVISGSAGVSLANAATAWAAISDETQKDIIEPVRNALASVVSWRKVIGKYKTDAAGTRRQFLIAQDVQKTTPEAIDTAVDGILSLRYSDTIPTIAASIEELSTKLDSVIARLTAAGI